MSSHLSSKQIATLSDQLQARYEILQEEVHEHLMGSGDQNYIEIAGQVHDRGDEAVAELFANLNYTVINSHVAELRAIEEALAKIQEQKYGVCSDCGMNIPFARLQASPTALRCITCQQVVEENLERTAHP